MAFPLSRITMKLQFNFNINVVIQVLSMILQVLNYATPVVPVKYQVFVTFAIAVVQALSALLAHFKNPDGTPAATPYVKG